MNTIYLHGAMRKRFGPSFTLAAKTPAEMIHALSCQIPEFRQAVANGVWRVVRGKLKGGRSLPVNQLGVNLPGEMHLVAAPQGAGGKGGGSTAKIIVGAVLLVAAVALTAGAAGGAALAAGTTTFGAVGGVAAGGAAAGLGTTVGLGLGLSVSAAQIGFLGASMLFAGISQAISPSPKASSRVAQDTRASFTFNGAINTTEQGVCLPLAIGRPRTGAVIIGVSIVAEDIG